MILLIAIFIQIFIHIFLYINYIFFFFTILALKKQISKKPIPVYVEECSYWIGFHALNWFQARVSCGELNASLVILDSPRIISHMMFLMEENQEGKIMNIKNNIIYIQK